MVDVVTTDEFLDWYENLDDVDAGRVFSSVEVLRAHGTQLSFPHSSKIGGTTVALFELRVQSRGRPLRIFYAFDPARDAVLIIGGDKGSEGDRRFYARMIPVAETIWAEYLAELARSRGEG